MNHDMRAPSDSVADDVTELGWKGFIIICAIVLALLAGCWGLIHLVWGTPPSGKAGEFGDMFGGVNALFSGLAFAGVIWAIMLQKSELRLQRKELAHTREELELTREEIKGQRDEMATQSKTFIKQNFDSTFFHMLSLHNDIVNNICVELVGGDKRGRNAFYAFLELMVPRTNDHQLSDAVADYESFYRAHEAQVGHYFRSLFSLLEFVHKSELEDRFFFANLVRNQLSSDELMLLFFHCLAVADQPAKDLVAEYALLKHLDKRKLSSPAQIAWFPPAAYGE